MELSKIQLFLTFIKADKRCSPQYSDEQRRKGIPVDKLDFPLLRYIFSIEQRLKMLTILRNKICDNKAIEELNKTQEKGFSSNEEGLILVIYYESFLNQIYNRLENLAKINLFLFDAKNPPHGFFDQMKQIKNKKLTFQPAYDELIKEDMVWCEEVHLIRSNSNHYLVGTNIYGRTVDGEWIPEYMNFNVSQRSPNKSSKIERNILNDTDFFYNATIKILNKISEIYIEKMDKGEPCAVTFIGKDEIEFRKISYSEFISGQKGKLIQKVPFKN